MDAYTNYVRGFDLKNRMPLWVLPKKKLSVKDIMSLVRNHLENSVFDFRTDVGSGPYNSPYRWRPLTWTVNGQKYVHERSVSTQQTGWSFVAHLRKHLPKPVGGLLWFGVDDTACTVYVPMYCGMTRVPDSYSELSGDMMKFSFQSAFWVTNMVSNYAYTRWRLIYPDVKEKIGELEDQFFTNVASMDEQAARLWTKSPTQAIELITEFSVAAGDTTTTQWLQFWQYLFVKYVDGYIKTPSPSSSNGFDIATPGYGTGWYKRIVSDTGDKYRIPNTTKRSSDSSNGGKTGNLVIKNVHDL
jgi:dipeptidase